MTADTFRRLALAMNGAVEAAHMGHPDFRANGRIFATLHPGDERATVKLSPEEQRELILEDPEAFVPASGAWGRQGYTDVVLRAADVAVVRGALVLAWQSTLVKPRRRRSATDGGRAAPTRRRRS